MKVSRGIEKKQKNKFTFSGINNFSLKKSKSICLGLVAVLSICLPQLASAKTFNFSSSVHHVKVDAGIKLDIVAGSSTSVVADERKVHVHVKGSTLEISVKSHDGVTPHVVHHPSLKPQVVKMNIAQLQYLDVSPAAVVKVTNLPIQRLTVHTHRSELKLSGKTVFGAWVHNNQIKAAVLGGSLNQMYTHGAVMLAGKDLQFKQLVWNSSHTHYTIVGNSKITDLLSSSQQSNLLIQGGQLYRIFGHGKLSLTAKNVSTDDFSITPKSKVAQSLRISGKNIKISALAMLHNQIAVLCQSGFIHTIKTSGKVTVIANNLIAQKHLVLMNNNDRILLTGSNMNLQDLKLSANSLTAKVNSGIIDSAFVSGRANLIDKNSLLKGEARLQVLGVGRFHAVLNAKTDLLSMSRDGIYCRVHDGSISKLNVQQNASFDGDNLSSKKLEVTSNKLGQMYLAGDYKIKSLVANPKQLQCTLYDGSTIDGLTLVGQAALYGGHIKSKKSLNFSSIGDGDFTMVGSAKISSIDKKGGRTLVGLSNGSVQRIMVRGNVSVHGSRLTGKNVVVIDHSDQPVILKGNLDVKEIDANRSAFCIIDGVNSDSLNVHLTDYASLHLLGKSKYMLLHLNRHAQFEGRKFSVTDITVSASNYAEAFLTPVTILRGLAHDYSKIYYYNLPKELTVVASDHALLLHVFAGSTVKQMFPASDQDKFPDTM